MSSCLLGGNPFDKYWRGGDTEEIIIRYKAPDKVTPIDLSEATAKIQLRKKSTSQTADLELDAVIDVELGEMVFTASSMETRALLNSKLKQIYVYDIQLNQGERITTLGSGKITVSLDITR